jgi:hypothetical protein
MERDGAWSATVAPRIETHTTGDEPMKLRSESFTERLSSGRQDAFLPEDPHLMLAAPGACTSCLGCTCCSSCCCGAVAVE